MRGWQNQVGYVPQSVYLTDDTVRRNVAFGLADDAIDDASVRRAVQAAQLEGVINSLPDGLETGLTPATLAHLLEFLRQPDPKVLPSN